MDDATTQVVWCRWPTRILGIVWLALSFLAVAYLLVGFPRDIAIAESPLPTDSLEHIKLHSALYLPWGDRYSACSVLEHIGNKDDMRPILHAMLRMDAKGETVSDPAFSQCARALATISGEDFGNDAKAWTQWWRTHSSH